MVYGYQQRLNTSTLMNAATYLTAPLRRVSQLFLPQRCSVCGGAADNRGAPTACTDRIEICSPCHAALPVNRQPCRRCGLPLGHSSMLTCGACLRRAPLYDCAYVAFDYAYPLAQLIRRCKYAGQLAPLRSLGLLLADYLTQQHRGAWPACVIPMPLHATRYRHRGYNQVIELGRALAPALNIPLRTDLVLRQRNTPEQAGLSRRARRANLRHAFVTSGAALPHHVALLDDVVTTGSTVNELAKTLRRAGVTQIEVWGLARVNHRQSS